MPLEIGDTLAAYEILALLGSGAMGTVYRARDTVLEREVALKVLSPELAANEQALERFRREARILASFTHENIGAIYGVDEDGDACFFVLELVPGTNLAERLSAGPIPEAQAFEIARQIAAGLVAAHQSGVVHRDLKPANVMLMPSGQVKVLDFGLAKRLEFRTGKNPTRTTPSSLTSVGMLIGTIDYMSPEQSRGLTVDGRTDIWAFGCILFELLSGVQVFPATTVPEKLAAIAADEPDWSQLPEATPSGVKRLLRHCLEKDLTRRAENLIEVARIMAAPADVRAHPVVRTIAVLPFANGSSEPSDSYLSDGITDEIISALGCNPGLRVASRTSSFSFRDLAVDIAEVGSRLGVDSVLEGSVRRAGDRVRITVQLIDVENGYRRWSDRFDCEMGDVLALEDAVAKKVAAALRVELGATAPTRSRRTENIRAYDLYLQARFFLEQRGSSLQRAIDSFRNALALDLNFAAAHAGLSKALSLASYYGTQRPSDLMPQARDAALRALQLDPQLAEAHTALAWVLLMYDWDTAGASQAFEQAIRLDPRAVQARLWHGCYIVTLIGRRFDAGIALCREAASEDPLSGSALAQVAVAQNFSGRWNEATLTIDEALKVDPNAYLLWFHRGLSQFSLGHFDDALRDFERATSLSPESVWAKSFLGATHARLGERGQAEAVQQDLLRQRGEAYISPTCLAITPVALGRLEESFALVQEGVRERDGFLRALPAFRVFDPLREDARFRELIEGVGLAL